MQNAWHLKKNALLYEVSEDRIMYTDTDACVFVYMLIPLPITGMSTHTEVVVNAKGMEVTRGAAGKKDIRADIEFAGRDLCNCKGECIK